MPRLSQSESSPYLHPGLKADRDQGQYPISTNSPLRNTQVTHQIGKCVLLIAWKSAFIASKAGDWTRFRFRCKTVKERKSIQVMSQYYSCNTTHLRNQLNQYQAEILQPVAKAKSVDQKHILGLENTVKICAESVMFCILWGSTLRLNLHWSPAMSHQHKSTWQKSLFQHCTLRWREALLSCWGQQRQTQQR